MTMVHTMMNLRWPIVLPAHRADRRVNPFWEAGRLAAMYARVNALADLHGRPARILDVGAEEGDFPCLYALWGAEVFLVEPNPKAWPWIKRTFEANHQQPAGWFVGLLGADGNSMRADGGWWPMRADDGRDFHWPACADDTAPTAEHGFHHLAEHALIDAVRTLDATMLAGSFTPDIITMDIEGGELHCLRGATATLDEARPEVFVSIHPEFMRDLYDQHPDELLSFMAQHDYRGQFICSDHEQHWHFVPRERPWPWSDPHR